MCTNMRAGRALAHAPTHVSARCAAVAAPRVDALTHARHPCCVCTRGFCARKRARVRTVRARTLLCTRRRPPCACRKKVAGGPCRGHNKCTVVAVSWGCAHAPQRAHVPVHHAGWYLLLVFAQHWVRVAYRDGPTVTEGAILTCWAHVRAHTAVARRGLEESRAARRAGDTLRTRRPPRSAHR